MDALMQRPESGSVDTERLRSVLAERSIALDQELGRGGMSAVYLARDLPERLRALAQETAAGTVVSGSYFRSGYRISFQAEITDANRGTLLSAVGPITAPVDRPGVTIDSQGHGIEAAIRRHLHPPGL